MEDVLINKTALFSPHLKWVLSVLISVLPTAGCRRVQVVFRLAGSLLKCSTCVSCPRSGERGPPWCRLYSVCSPSHVTTAHRVGFFLSKTTHSQKKQLHYPLETKNTTNAQKNTVACVLCRTESPARARPGGPWSNCIKLKINAVRCSLDRAGNRGWRQLISRRQTKNTKSN